MSVEILSLGPCEVLSGIRWRLHQLADSMSSLSALALAIRDDPEERFAEVLASARASSLCDDLVSRVHRLEVMSRDLRAVVSRHHHLLAGLDSSRGLDALLDGEAPNVGTVLEGSVALETRLLRDVWPRLPRSLRSYCRERARRHFAGAHGWLAQASAGLTVARRVTDRQRSR